MKISNTFEVVPYSLYSVRYRSEELHEFRGLFESWNDPLFLEEFFESHKADLLGYWNEMTVEDAVIRTMKEARRLEGKLLQVAEKGASNKLERLSSLFRPLHNFTQRLDQFEKSKVAGHIRDSWIRIYAVRIDVNLFVISGGAIKLTRTMNERAHLLQELKKMEIVCNYLESDRDDEFGVFELF